MLLSASRLLRMAGCRRLISDASGASAIITALSMSGLMGFSALGVDVGIWYADHNTAQSAADSAAYSADVDLASGASASEVTSVAKAVAAKYGDADGVNGVTVTVNTPPTSGTHMNSNAVEVIISKPEHLFFSSFFLGQVSVGGRAVAASKSTGGDACLQTLDTNDETSLSTNGTVTVNTPGCGIYVDSFGSSAMQVSGTSGSVNALNLSVVGGLSTTGHPTITVTGTSSVGSVSPIPDPYAGVPIPAPGSCAPGPVGNVFSPGTYCSGINLTATQAYTMSPGVYIIPGGQSFSLGGGVTMNATGGVTIILTGSGSNWATMNLAGGSTLNLVAPSTGTYAGLAVLQDPAEPPSTQNQAQSSMVGGSTMNIIGALDFPTQNVAFTGNSGSVTLPNGTTVAACSQLIAYKAQLTGVSSFQNTCASSGERTSGLKVALVE